MSSSHSAMLDDLTQPAEPGAHQSRNDRVLLPIGIGTCALIALLVYIYWSGLQQMVHHGYQMKPMAMTFCLSLRVLHLEGRKSSRRCPHTGAGGWEYSAR